jgi:glycosyltransferase involved in cell wall biosynthesis
MRGREVRLAWFTPLPPVRSGIAAYSAELLPLLAPHYEIDVFTSPPPPLRGFGVGPNPAEAGFHEDGCEPRKPASAGFQVFGAHDFLWKHERAPYDLVVYQLGNAACHDFMWPHLARFPGLVVLHDGQVHHERSRALLSRGRVEEYRAEFRYNHPEAPEHLPDLVIATLGGSLYYLYPMLRWVVRTARLVAVHSEGLAREIREAHPGVEVRTVPMGVPDPVTPASLGVAATLRRRHQVPDGALVFAAFGLVTPEKRISAILRGLVETTRRGIDSYLLLVGGGAAHYDAIAEASAMGIADRVRLTGYVPDEDLGAYLRFADVCSCLRWPTSRETSAMWVRAIAAGRPTVITDLAHTADVPSLDPRTWRRTGDPPAGSDAAGAVAGAVARDFSPVPTGQDFNPVSITIDVLDEDTSVTLAMRRLAADAELRERLGANARAWWQAHHTMALAVEGYRAAIERALQRPAPRVTDLPGHLSSDDVYSLARRLTAECGAAVDLLRDAGLTSLEREDRLGPSNGARHT